ncbi:30S ribosomal protein S20 [soil metagenome]
MANTAQAKKRIRQAEKRRQRNASLRSRFRTTLKKVLVAIESGVKTTAQAAFQEAVPIIDGMVGKGIIHKNKAARHKSRLNARVKALAA